MNFFRRLFHRPSARIVTAFERERARACLAYDEAVRRGDTRLMHQRHEEAKRLTAQALRMELGR